MNPTPPPRPRPAALATGLLAAALLLVGAALLRARPGGEPDSDVVDGAAAPEGPAAPGRPTEPTRRVTRTATAPAEEPPFIYPSFPLSVLHPRPAGYGTVTCDINPLGRDSAADLGSVTPNGTKARSEARLYQGRLVADVPAGSGSATYRLGTGTGEFTWEDLPEGGAVACSGFTARWKTGVSGRVVGQPLPNAYVGGCGGQVALSGIENETIHFEVDAPLDCELRVWVGDGDREAYGPTVPVRTELGRDTLVTLEMPKPEDFRQLTAEELANRRRIDAQIAAIHDDCRKSPDCAARLRESEREKAQVHARIAAGEREDE